MNMVTHMLSEKNLEARIKGNEGSAIGRSGVNLRAVSRVYSRTLGRQASLVVMAEKKKGASESDHSSQKPR